MPALIQIKAIALPNFRKEEHLKQKSICPILKKEFPISDMVVDHKHKAKKDPISKHTGGLIRGVIHNSANRIEGKITGAYKRLGLEKQISLPELLRNLADYLENPPLGYKYIHPSEETKEPKEKFYKRDYKLIEKYWSRVSPKAKKLPEYPKPAGKNTIPFMTKKWKELLIKAQAIHTKEK